MVGVTPGDLTLRNLLWMVMGKAEFLGGTSSGPSTRRSDRDGVIPYDPNVMRRWQGEI